MFRRLNRSTGVGPTVTDPRHEVSFDIPSLSPIPQHSPFSILRSPLFSSLLYLLLNLHLFPSSGPIVILCLLPFTMSLPVRRLTHTAPRTLARISRLPTLASRISVPTLTPRTPRTPRFSTMAARQSAAPTVPTDRPYDPEIQDMASYIHDYKVDSDLAVCRAGNRNREPC
jgi:hypothetical protein